MAEFSLDNLYLDEALIDVRHPDSLFFNDKKAELVSKLGNILPNYSIQPDNTIALFNPEMKTNANISINRFGLTYSEPKDVDEFILFVKSFSKTVLDFQKPIILNRVGIRYFFIKDTSTIQMAQKFITKNFLRYNYFPNSFKANNMTTEIIFHIQKNYKINLRFAPIGRQIINITENHTEAKRRWGLLIDADFYIENIPFNDSFDFFQDSKKYLLNDVCNFLNSF